MQEMPENIITITNPLIFWDKSYIQKTLNTLCYGDESTVEIKIITFNEMTKEIGLKFIFPELALKFMKSYNNKPLDQLVNHKLIIHLGPSDKSSMITPKKRLFIMKIIPNGLMFYMNESQKKKA